MNLRPAAPSDVSLLRQWDEQPHVIEASPNDDWAWETELGHIFPWREQLIAEVDGRPVGYLEIIDPARDEEHYWGVVPEGLRAIDIWIGDASDLGKGYGTCMMLLALVRCFNNPTVMAVLIDPLASNFRAHRFYERLGFRFVGSRQFGADHCFVYRLDRPDWEHDRSCDASSDPPP
jgi:aminoglycoside 6'-N-acetyltransferase